MFENGLCIRLERTLCTNQINEVIKLEIEGKINLLDMKALNVTSMNRLGLTIQCYIILVSTSPCISIVSREDVEKESC